jgi:hypothetical protein
MEDDLIFSGNGRRPQFFKEMEDYLNFFGKWKTTSISGYGRRPQFFQEMETTSIFQEMEDDLSFSGNGRRLKFSENGIPPQFNIS